MSKGKPGRQAKGWVTSQLYTQLGRTRHLPRLRGLVSTLLTLLALPIYEDTIFAVKKQGVDINGIF